MTTPTYIPDLSLDTREGWKAAYEAREREAHDLSERLIVTNRTNASLRAANAALTEALRELVGTASGSVELDDWPELQASLANARAALEG